MPSSSDVSPWRHPPVIVPGDIRTWRNWNGWYEGDLVDTYRVLKTWRVKPDTKEGSSSYKVGQLSYISSSLIGSSSSLLPSGFYTFQELIPVWGGGDHWVEFAETGWVFYKWDKSTDRMAVNPFPVFDFFIPYPLTPTYVYGPKILGSSERGDEPYMAGGIGMLDAGANGVIVGPLVLAGDGFHLVALQAKPTKTADLAIESFKHGNTFDFPIQGDGFDLVPDGLWFSQPDPESPVPDPLPKPVEVVYNISNPLANRASFEKSPNLAVAVELEVKTPLEGAEGVTSLVAGFSQTLGSTSPWVYVEVLPDCNITNEMTLEWCAVLPTPIPPETPPTPLVESNANIVCAGASDIGEVGILRVHMAPRRVLILPGVPAPDGPGGITSNVVLEVSPSPVASPDPNDVSTLSVVSIPIEGIRSGAVGEMIASQPQVLSFPGVGGLAMGDVATGASACLKPIPRPARTNALIRIGQPEYLVMPSIPANDIAELVRVAHVSTVALPGAEVNGAVGTIRTTFEGSGLFAGMWDGHTWRTDIHFSGGQAFAWTGSEWCPLTRAE